MTILFQQLDFPLKKKKAPLFVVFQINLVPFDYLVPSDYIFI